MLGTVWCVIAHGSPVRTDAITARSGRATTAAGVKVAFVIPCLNEARVLRATAASLGFGEVESRADPDVHLILVDNGSSDETWQVMEQIAAHSPPGSVEALSERERGYVPPRRTGALFVRELAERSGTPFGEWLILQADADTQYLPGYAEWMAQFIGERRNVLLEGAIKRDAEFEHAHPAYRALEDSVDLGVSEPPVSDEDEVVVDDKACGYLLADYLAWGGHTREYDAFGDEIHAETTRLFLHARLAHGATKIRVNPAQAIHSRRRILADPALQFATAGFPREREWVEQWHAMHPPTQSVEEFVAAASRSKGTDAKFYRRAHTIALFWLLPWVVQRSMRGASLELPDERTADLLSIIPELTADELARFPRLALTTVLSAIEEYPNAFL